MISWGKLMSVYTACLLEGLSEEGQRSRILITKGSDDNRRGTNDLSGVAILIHLAETGPLAELLLVSDHDERNSLLLSQSLDKLLVGWLVAALAQENELGVSRLEGLGDLVKTSDNRASSASILQHFLDRRSVGNFLSYDLSGHYLEFTKR